MAYRGRGAARDADHGIPMISIAFGHGPVRSFRLVLAAFFLSHAVIRFSGSKIAQKNV